MAFVGIAMIFSLAVASAEPQSPADVFGFQPGDDYKLASYEQMESYYRQLAAESDRVQLREIGNSALGRSLYLLTISSEENLANLDRYRSISEQLARARVDSETAAALASEGKAVVWIDGGLHATELAHGQMTPLLAHRVATEESVEMREIRNNVIFLLMPVMNPDGLEIVRKWYESQLGTPYEQTNPPELYHHYVGHDNNRDFFMNNMPESKAVAQVVYNEWYPQIVYNQHQSSPGYARSVIPPYSDPVNPIIHPGVTTVKRNRQCDGQSICAGENAGRRIGCRLFDVVERRHADGPVLPQYDRHPYRNRSRLAIAENLRS
jgi:murein tripeptide amidase MpaA